MTIKRMIFIICLVAALCAAKFAYDKHFGPKNATATQQQEEARKLAQLKADLYRAAGSGRPNTNFSTNSRYDQLKKKSKTGST
jgi:hypothetical protein